jgi:hypothetical protein
VHFPDPAHATDFIRVAGVSMTWARFQMETFSLECRAAAKREHGRRTRADTHLLDLRSEKQWFFPDGAYNCTQATATRKNT